MKSGVAERMAALFNRIMFGEICAVCYWHHEDVDADHMYVCEDCWDRIGHEQQEYFKGQAVAVFKTSKRRVA